MRDKEAGRIRTLDLVDTHSGGDVSRVVVGGVKAVTGDTVRQKQQYLEAHGDGLRRLLLNEPYGDPAMSVNLIVEPFNPRAQVGYIIMEAMGYPMYSGSNTICTATAVLESGMLEMVEGEQRLILESPAGLAAFGDAFVRQVRSEFVAEHPELGNVGPLPFMHFMGPVEKSADGGFRSRSATYVHPGVICRSPTGTGTSARLALMYERGQIGTGQWLETTSPRNSSFRGDVLGESRVHDIPALNSSITGQARVLAHSRITVDLDDPLVDEQDLALVLDVR